MSETMTAPDLMALAHAESPQIYECGDCWRFRWAGQDHGSFDTEHSARSAALRFRQQTMLKHVAASLHLR